MALRIEATPDNPKKISILYGPIVLGGMLQDSQSDIPAVAVSGKPVDQWVEREPGNSLRFRTVGVGRPHDVALKPFYQLVTEPYTVYWDME
jgi:hypothetical protein